MLAPGSGSTEGLSHWRPRSGELLETTVGDLLRDVAEEVPTRTALIDGSVPQGERRRWTYADLLEVVDRGARNLRVRFEVGERVAIWGANCPEWVIAQLAIEMAGLVLVPVDPAYRVRELTYVLAQSEAAGLLRADAHRGTDLAPIIAEAREQLPALRHVMSLTDEDVFAEDAPPFPRPDAGPGDTVQIQYTSGTTGVPKGAEMHHRAVVNTSYFCAGRAGFGAGDVWINMMPLSHIAGCVTATLGPISRRGTQVILPGFDAGRVLSVIEEEGGTLILAVPTMLIAMLDHDDFPRCDLTSLRCVLSGAATVPVHLVGRVKRAMGCDFSIVYGLTESPILVQTHLDDSDVDQSETIGQPQAKVELAVVDPISQSIQPYGEPGEIWARCYQTMNGYFRMPEATEQSVTSNGWIRTGDLGRMDERGYVSITGRLKEMIVRGGENIYPREIEEVLFAHQKIADVAVVGVPDDRWGEVVAAIVRMKDGEQLLVEDLYEYCSHELAYSKAPVLWAAVEDFPMTLSGKIQKHRLRDLVVEGAIEVERVPAREGTHFQTASTGKA